MKSCTVLNILLFFESRDGWRRLKDLRIEFSHIVAFSSCGVHWLLLCHGSRSTVRVFSEESGDESTEHFSAMQRKVVERLAFELSTLCGTDRLSSGGDQIESGAAGRDCTTRTRT